MSGRGSYLAFAIVCFSLFVAPTTRAAEHSGDLSGTVRDDKGALLPGATITLRAASLQGERSTLSDVEGEFVFKALPPGAYTIRAGAPDHQSIEMDGVPVHVGRSTQIDLVLIPGKQPESVKVVASMPPIDVVRAQTQDAYPNEYLGAAPIASDDRGPQAVVANSAGTSGGEDEEPSVRGSSRGTNLYLIDGLDMTDPVTGGPGIRTVFDAIQEVQVQTGGFNAEFGRTAGGIVSIVTKSGGNDFSGSFDGRYQNQSFIERGRHFDPDEERSAHRILEATAGGPIVEDRLWFFLAGSHLADDLGGEDFGSVRRERTRADFGKLTWQLAPAHRFVLQTLGDPSRIENADAGPLVAGEASSRMERGSRLVSVQYQGILDPDLILQGAIARERARLDLGPESGDARTVGWIDFVSGRRTRNATDSRRSALVRDQTSLSLTWNRPDVAGDHTFKIGVDRQRLVQDLEARVPGNEFDVVARDAGGSLVPLAYNVFRSAGRVRTSGALTGAFAQDEWRILPTFSITLGVRHDSAIYEDDRGDRVLSTRLLQPRLGISWDVSGDARNVLKLTGARVSAPFPLTLPRAAGSRADATTLFVDETIAGYYAGRGPTPLDTNGDGTIESRAFVARFGGPGGQVFARRGRLDPTIVDEATASYEHQIGAESAAGITLVTRRTSHIVDNRFDAARGIFEIDNRADLWRSYRGVELRLRGRWGRLFFNGSYTWSRSRGNIDATGGLAEDYDFKDLSRHREGWMSGDARHNLQTAGWYELPWRLRLVFDYDWTSGSPWTVTRPAFPYGERFLTDRGARRLPARDQLDLGLSRGFPVGKAELRVLLGVENAFGAEAVTEVETREAHAGRPLEWQTPRHYEVGARVAF